MQYRLLGPEEWPKLNAVIPAEHVPPPEIATAAVAEEDGRILGAFFLQLSVRMEPLFILNARVNFLRLHHTLLDSIRDRTGMVYFALTGNERTARMAEHMGLESLGTQEVWIGRVR